MLQKIARKKHHVIYKTTCSVTGRYYIGMHSTDELEDGYLGSGKRLWQSIRKHGKESHMCEILEHLPSRDALRLRETELVNEELIGDPMCMNIALGGSGGWSTEQMKRIWENPNYVEKQKARPYFEHKGETLETLSNATKVQWRDPSYREWKSNQSRLTGSTEEYKAKQRAAWTPERKAKHSAFMKKLRAKQKLAIISQ